MHLSNFILNELFIHFLPTAPSAVLKLCSEQMYPSITFTGRAEPHDIPLHKFTAVQRQFTFILKYDPFRTAPYAALFFRDIYACHIIDDLLFYGNLGIWSEPYIKGLSVRHYEGRILCPCRIYRVRERDRFFILIRMQLRRIDICFRSYLYRICRDFGFPVNRLRSLTLLSTSCNKNYKDD